MKRQASEDGALLPLEFDGKNGVYKTNKAILLFIYSFFLILLVKLAAVHTKRTLPWQETVYMYVLHLQNNFQLLIVLCSIWHSATYSSLEWLVCNINKPLSEKIYCIGFTSKDYFIQTIQIWRFFLVNGSPLVEVLLGVLG